MHRPILAAALLTTLMTAGCSVFGGKAAPEPSYETLVQDTPYEVRRYPAVTVARTRVAGDFDDAIGTGFNRLFDYITGDNAGGAEIGMTAPVVAEPEGTEIAMTAPVLAAEDADGWWISFVLPEDMTAESAPQPTDPQVEIATIPARRVAVVQFSGFLGDGKITENRAALMDWIAARNLEATQTWQAAGYNPPWTLPWLRRNEVLVTLAE